MKNMLLLIVALLAIAVLAISSTPTYAGKGKHAAAVGTKYHGKVQAINTTTDQITIDSKKGGVHTFTITGSTKINVDGAAAQASAIHVGMHALIRSVDGTNATVIRIGKRKTNPLA